MKSIWKSIWNTFQKYLYLNTFAFKSICIRIPQKYLYLYLNTFQCIWPHVYILCSMCQLPDDSKNKKKHILKYIDNQHVVGSIVAPPKTLLNMAIECFTRPRYNRMVTILCLLHECQRHKMVIKLSCHRRWQENRPTQHWCNSQNRVTHVILVSTVLSDPVNNRTAGSDGFVVTWTSRHRSWQSYNAVVRHRTLTSSVCWVTDRQVIGNHTQGLVPGHLLK